MRKILERLSHPNEEGFELVSVMVAMTIMAILAAAFAPLVFAFGSVQIQKPVEDDVRNAVTQAATYFNNNPASGPILTATPGCEGGARNIPGLLVTISTNSTCISVWGSPSSPSGFFVRGTHPNLDGELVYSSREQKYIRSGAYATGRDNTPTQGAQQ